MMLVRYGVIALLCGVVGIVVCLGAIVVFMEASLRCWAGLTRMASWARRWLPVLVLLVIPVAGHPESDRVWKDRFRLWPVLDHCGCNYYGQRFMIGLYMLENGSEGRELGYENPDASRNVCPCLPKLDRNFQQGTLAFMSALQTYVLSDSQRRAEFFRIFADFYHSNGAEKDTEYTEELRATWRRAGVWMKARGLDQTRTATVHPFEPCGWGSTTWHP